MAEIAINFLVNQLSTWLQEENTLLGDLRGETKLIHDNLEMKKKFLRAADEKEENDPLLETLVRQTREIAYGIEDTLESYMLQSIIHGSSDGINACISGICTWIKNWKAKHDMASQIKELRIRAEYALEQFQKMHEVLATAESPRGIASEEWHDGRSDALLLEERDILGIDKPKEQLLKWIQATDYKFKVVSVVGMAGLGKTTLAKKVYDDMKKNTNHHIWITVWITVSKTCKVKNLLQKLVKQLVKEPPPDTLESKDGMRDLIYKSLTNKKYIIVLDDVWKQNVWDALKFAFPKNNTYGQGCVIITTRNDDIGAYACCESGSNVHKMQPLSTHDARELFFKKAFPCGQRPTYLKKFSDVILRKCEGLPLAIVVIGGVLATKGNDIEEWSKFSHNLKCEQEGDDPLKRMWRLLFLSYYDLPYYLKACLLFLSIFPEDMLLKKATIIRLWAGVGIVEAKHEKIEEEIAERYLNELCIRNLIQIVEVKFGKPRNFRIHDLVREYIVSRARKQNLILSQTKTTSDAQIRLLGLEDNIVGHVDQINKFKSLRALLFFGSRDQNWQPIICKVLGGECRLLKELDLRGAPLDDIPNEVFKLYLLKYLCLRDTNVLIIPELIRNLEKLETLDLKGTKVIELPMEILKVQRLRCLLVYKYVFPSFHFIQDFKAPYEIGQLVCLQKLCYIDASANGEGIKVATEIGKLTKLQRLGITKLRKEDGKKICSSMENLTCLSSLNIGSFDEDEVIDLDYRIPPTSLQFLRLLHLKGRLEKMPQWISSLVALKRLTLRWSKLYEDPLEYLQDLPILEILRMVDWAYEGEGLYFKSGGFKSLKEFYLESSMGLRWVTVEKGSMPILKSFTIGNCKAMTKLPMGIEHLTSLNFDHFYNMSKDFFEDGDDDDDDDDDNEC